MKQAVESLPVVFLRHLAVYPSMSVTVVVGRDASRRAVQAASEHYDGRLAALTQLRAEDARADQLSAAHSIGTVCRIEKAITLTDGSMQIQLRGEACLTPKVMREHAGVLLVEGVSRPPISGGEAGEECRMMTERLEELAQASAADRVLNLLDQLKQSTHDWEFLAAAYQLIGELQAQRGSDCAGPARIEQQDRAGLVRMNQGMRKRVAVLGADSLENCCAILSDIIRDELGAAS